MKRVYVDEGIYIIINKNGKVSSKCFEVAKRRKYRKLGEAMKLFKLLYSRWESVYLYQTNGYFMVEFKSYVEDIETALLIKNQVENILEEFEEVEK